MVQRCSNGIGFVVLEPEPSFNTGISLEIYDAANPVNLLDVLPDSFARKWTDPRKGPGAGEFKVYAGNSHIAANPGLLKAGNIVRMLLDRVPRFAFKIEKRQLVQIQEGEDSKVAWHISGRGALSLLEDGQIWPAGGLAGDPERPFVEATPGEVLATLVGEAQARSNSILNQITEGYTATTDSNNIPFDINVTLDERAGTDLLRVAERITELAADVYMSPTLDLKIYNSRGIDRTVQTNDFGPVVLQKGSNITELERSEDAVIRNALLIETPGGFVERIEAASVTEYRRREAYLSLGNITDGSQIDRAADAVFERSANPAEAITIRVTDTEGRRPYVDFGVGDWVFAPNINGILERYRVGALTIAEDDAGDIEAIPELATITDDLEERLSKWLKSMARGTMGGTAADVTEPNKVTAEVTGAIDDSLGEHVATFPHPDEFSDLADVDITGLNAGDLVQFDGTDWVPLDGTEEGDVLYRNALGFWVPVVGVKAEGKVPTIQTAGNVAWLTPTGGGGDPDVVPLAPDEITGLEQWLDADAITGLVDTDPVATWSDLSGNGFHMTQAVAANRPLYRTGIINGLPVVRFDNVNDGLTGGPTLTHPFSIFYVAAAVTVGGNRRIIQSGTTNWLLGPYGGNWQWFSGAFAANLGPATAGQTVIHGVTQNSAAGAHFLKIDGAITVFPTGIDSGGVTYTSRAAPTAIGALRMGTSGSANEPAASDVAEVVVYDRELTVDEGLGLVAHLATKWGIA